MEETIFHHSVMKWLHENRYKFWWEHRLPNSKMRPDFFAVALTGEKFVIECKSSRIESSDWTIGKLKKYSNLLGDADVSFCLAFPVGLNPRKVLIEKCQIEGFQVFHIPVVSPTPMRYSEHIQRPFTIANYFPSFPNKRRQTA